MPENNDIIHFDKVVMSFDKTNSSVTVTYSLNFFARMYIFAFGTRHLESSFIDIFSKYEDVKIEEVGYDTVKISLKDVSRLSDDYYLHDRRDLGTIVHSMEVIYPNGQTKTLNDVKATPNIFYQQI
ncbi:hypothetical protein [Methanococcoides alaskense]|uniref:Uncharacterized protein n=1 Tax=Methanococcoides alaskense TaxID=325778 RepID=A0AA90U058_9EURY|nr:hypothetical protein [Methanococcoides alaskense]MDR6223380.1 hypothetical protein [Methanococcoides alaskense]